MNCCGGRPHHRGCERSRYCQGHRRSCQGNIESLIKAGALSEFKLNKKTLMENLDELINYSSLCSDIDASLVLKPEINYYEEYSEAELMDVEYNTFGFYINNHPVSKYKRNDFRYFNCIFW